MLQEQHDKQMETMATTNKANMDAMMEQMNAMVTAGSGRRSNDKENALPAANNKVPAGDKTKKPKQKKKLCPNCKTFIFHSPQKCYELEANKDTHYQGWKLVHAVA